MKKASRCVACHRVCSENHSQWEPSPAVVPKTRDSECSEFIQNSNVDCYFSESYFWIFDVGIVRHLADWKPDEILTRRCAGAFTNATHCAISLQRKSCRILVATRIRPNYAPGGSRQDRADSTVNSWHIRFESKPSIFGVERESKSNRRIVKHSVWITRSNPTSNSSTVMAIKV